MLNLVSCVVFDVLVVVLTVYRTARIAWMSRESNIKQSLSFVLLRDGPYFHLHFSYQMISFCRNVLLWVRVSS